MGFITALITLAFAAIAIADGKLRFGPGFIMGDSNGLPASGAYIKHFKTTLNLGNVPDEPHKMLVVWPGLITDKQDVVQSIAGNMNPESLALLDCKDRNTTWCLFSYTLDCTDDGSDNLCNPIYSDESVSVQPNTAVDIEYVYDEKTNSMSQAMKYNGAVVSSLTTTSGKPYQLQVEIECQLDCYDNEIMVFEHSYMNNTIEFSQFDISYRQHWSVTKDYVEVSQPKIYDGGRRWVFDAIRFKTFTWAANGAPLGQIMPGTGSKRIVNLNSADRFNAILAHGVIDSHNAMISA